jgi:hypothetical protein
MAGYGAGTEISLLPAHPHVHSACNGTAGAVLNRVNSSWERLRATPSGLLGSVREVVVLASSSRSGSSLFAELLKHSPEYLSFQGELNPFLRLAGLVWPDSGTGSDSLSESHATVQATGVLDGLLSAEAGSASEDVCGGLPHGFIENLYRRLGMQWPLQDFSIGTVASAASLAFDQVEEMHGRPCDWHSDLAHFHALFLLELRKTYPEINPYYYDINRELLRRLSPETPRPSGPPSRVIVEEPPFILIQPWQICARPDLERRGLVVKAPSNSYRLGFLRAVFPAASFRILHLTRNPAAGINGICDGWRHWGFHSHYLGPDLHMDGISPADRGWWKFDLPPGWEQYTQGTIEQVSAFQWLAAQRAIAEQACAPGTDYFRIRFEDVLTGFRARPEALDQLREWLGDENFLGEDAGDLPHVMTTKPPVPGRWRENHALVDTVLRDSAVLDMARHMGYEDPSKWM